MSHTGQKGKHNQDHWPWQQEDAGAKRSAIQYGPIYCDICIDSVNIYSENH